MNSRKDNPIYVCKVLYIGMVETQRKLGGTQAEDGGIDGLY